MQTTLTKMPPRVQRAMFECLVCKCVCGYGWPRAPLFTIVIATEQLTDSEVSCIHFRSNICIFVGSANYSYIHIIVIVDHGQSGVVYNFGRVCLSDDNFRKPWCRKFIFAHTVYLQGIWVKFVYQGHRVKVKVTGAETV